MRGFRSSVMESFIHFLLPQLLWWTEDTSKDALYIGESIHARRQGTIIVSINLCYRKVAKQTSFGQKENSTTATIILIIELSLFMEKLLNLTFYIRLKTVDLFLQFI